MSPRQLCLWELPPQKKKKVRIIVYDCVYYKDRCINTTYYSIFLGQIFHMFSPDLKRNWNVFLGNWKYRSSQALFQLCLTVDKVALGGKDGEIHVVVVNMLLVASELLQGLLTVLFSPTCLWEYDEPFCSSPCLSERGKADRNLGLCQ